MTDNSYFFLIFNPNIIIKSIITPMAIKIKSRGLKFNLIIKIIADTVSPIPHNPKITLKIENNRLCQTDTNVLQIKEGLYARKKNN